MTRWYVRVGGKVYGPYEMSRLQQMAASSEIARGMDVSPSGNGPWRKAESVSGLFTSVGVAPARPPDNPRRPSDGTRAAHGVPPPQIAPPPRPQDSRRRFMLVAMAGGLAFLAAAVLIPLVWWLGVRTSPRGAATDVAAGESLPVEGERDDNDTGAPAKDTPDESAVQPESGKPYVTFAASHVLSHYNLKPEDLGRIQVWNYGEIHAVEVKHRADERAGEVRNGQVVARNANTEVQKPVRIPHLTPGIVTQAEGFNDDTWVDFGEIQVQFDQTVFPNNTVFGQRKRVVADEGQDKNGFADALPLGQEGFRVRVVTRTEGERDRYEEWQCHLEGEPSLRPFLVYKGGSRSDRNNVEVLPEKRATGRSIE